MDCKESLPFSIGRFTIDNVYMSGHCGSWSPNVNFHDHCTSVYSNSTDKKSVCNTDHLTCSFLHVAMNEIKNEETNEEILSYSPGICKHKSPQCLPSPNMTNKVAFTAKSESLESLECSSGSDELSSGYTSTTDGLALDVPEENVQEALDHLNHSIEVFDTGLQMNPCSTNNPEPGATSTPKETGNSLAAGITLNPANLPLYNKVLSGRQMAYNTLDATPRHEFYVNSVAPGRLKRSRPSLDVLRNAIVVSTIKCKVILCFIFLTIICTKYIQ